MLSSGLCFCYSFVVVLTYVQGCSMRTTSLTILQHMSILLNACDALRYVVLLLFHALTPEQCTAEITSLHLPLLRKLSSAVMRTAKAAIAKGVTLVQR